MSIRAALLQELGNGRLSPEIRSLAAGLTRLGVPYELFVEKHLTRRQLPLDRAVLVAGHIPVVLSALRQLDVEPPVPNDYPVCLQPWLHRRMWKSTVRQAVTQIQEGFGLPFFAKPFGRHKRFTGRVFESWDDLRAIGNTSDDTEVICSEVVNWKSEYRTYVARGEILGTCHYQGSPSVTLDQTVIQDAVACFESSGDAPAGYGIDFGVLDTGQTALIEVNDGYGLGSYGLDDALYTRLSIERWCEMVAAHP